MPGPVSQSYTAVARYLHWLSAILVLSTLPAGLAMIQKGIDRPLQDTLFIYHKNVGVVLLVLVLIRIAWRLMNPPPPLPDSLPDWQKSIASATHLALYALLLTMTFSGYIRVTAGGFPIEMLNAIGIPPLAPRSDALANVAKTVHYWARFLLALLILAHIGAALMHGIVKRDGVFSRMWPRRAG